MLALLTTSTARASNFCLSFGAAKVVASGLTIPAKGTCAAFNGYYLKKPGFLLAGDVCKSSDGTTVLFNTFTQFNGLPDSLVGSWSTSSGTGSGNECTSANCLAFGVAVTKCPNSVPVPAVRADLLNFESRSASTFSTQEP